MSTYRKTVGGIGIKSDLIGLNAYWFDQRFEYSDGDLIYKGANVTHDAPTDQTDWEIWKYTWSGTDLVRIEGPLQGAWDNRATLAWA